MDSEFGSSRCKLLYTEWINKVLLHSTGKCIQFVCAQLYLTLCDTMDYNLPGDSIHGIFQARILEWRAISSSRGSSQPRDPTCVSYTAGRHFSAEPLGMPIYVNILILVCKMHVYINSLYIYIYIICYIVSNFFSISISGATYILML